MDNELWVPDIKLCTEQHKFRMENEWKRSTGGEMKPSMLGIERYRWGPVLPDKFYEGRNPPPVPIDSAENIEWYEEQLRRSIYGFEYKGFRITGDHYWALNFVPFLIALKDKNGNPTTNFDIDFPYFSYMHDYIFKLIEEAHHEGKGFMWMAGRAVGKSYLLNSIIAKYYYLKPNSHSVVACTNAHHTNETFGKLKDMLIAIDKAHPTLALARLEDTKYFIRSGYEVNRDGVKMESGPMSKVQGLIFGDNPDATRGTRPDIFFMDEIGAWSTGKANLKTCISASWGSWKVGSIKKGRVFMAGTGGSVASDQAREIFTNPKAYNLLAVNDFAVAGKKTYHCMFLPADYLYGGMWEKYGVNNNEESRKILDQEREDTREDIELHDKIVQEFPYTIEEVFQKKGTNIFNQKKIAKQWTDIQFGADHIIKPERGFLEWKRSKSGKIVGVEWVLNPNGNIEIVEHPFRGKSGKEIFNDLYIAGVDSIDQGKLDSTSTKDRSSLACLIKKRIVDGAYFSQTSNIYVAKYLGRSLDVRDDYEEVLKLSMYYNAKVNLEYTKVGLRQFFIEKHQFHRLMKRPAVAMPSASDGDLKRLGYDNRQHLIGTTTATHVIDHQDGKIKEYIQDFCHLIFFEDLLEQLRDYDREDRKKSDLVVAMGLCEIADEDMLGEPAKAMESVSQELEEFGYYYDEYGFKHFGVIPKKNRVTINDFIEEDNRMGYRWIDSTGVPRFDDKYDVQDARDLEFEQ